MGKPIERKYMSPYIGFGEELNLSSNIFTKLKSKGETIKFRILGIPYYEGKHFLKKEDGSWDVVPCVRINNKQECEHCKKFFSIQNDIKKMVANKESDETIKQAKKEARKYGSTVSVYYPIINRNTETFQIFQTGTSIRTKLEEEIKLGTKALEKDFIVLRTEQAGNYYTLSKVDSADSKDFTEKELAEVEKYKLMDMEDVIAGVKANDDELSVTKDDSINF